MAEMIEITVESIIGQTHNAINIIYHGDPYWLPKSQIEYAGTILDTDVEIKLPQWLAEKKGMV